MGSCDCQPVKILDDRADTNAMDVVFETFKNQTLSCESTDVIEIVAFETTFCCESLVEPYEALILYESELLPVVGPLPQSDAERKNSWVIVFETHGQICHGVPELVPQASHESEAA